MKLGKCLLASQVLIFMVSAGWTQQKLSGIEREEAQGMLKNIAGDVRKHYYDPGFHGVDWDAKVQETKNKIDSAPSMNMALSSIAGLMDSLNDSHTFLLPPSRPFRHDYGYRAQMVGDHCMITRIRPKTDAANKGLKPGDEILGIEGYAVTGADLPKMEYVYNLLRPRGSLHLTLRRPSGEEGDIEIQAKVRETSRITDLTDANLDNEFWKIIRDSEHYDELTKARIIEEGDELAIFRLPEFDLSDSQIEGVMDIARKHKALIIDLRGNPGGSVDTLRAMVGSVFESEVKINDRVSRDKNKDKPVLSKFNYHKSFTGKLTVLVDNQSGSAAEIFARVIQLQKRGLVMGDRTSGSVMEAVHHGYQVGSGTVVFFGASITDSDIIMTDGKSLEHVGVTPDMVALPSAADLAAGRDPVLAKAAQDLGAKLSPEDAGKMFPYVWPED